MNLDTYKLINSLSGKNRTFIKRIVTYHKQKFGIEEYFQLVHVGAERVEFRFMNHWAIFFFVIDDLVEIISDDQRNKYLKSLDSCAIELHAKFRNNLNKKIDN